MKFHNIIIVFFIILILIIICCPQPGGGDGGSGGGGGGGGGGETPTVKAPNTINAAFDNNTGAIYVEWENVNVDNYQVYKKVDNNDYQEVIGGFVNDNRYYDRNYNFGEQISYKVKSEKGGLYSNLSIESNKIQVDESQIIHFVPIKPTVKSLLPNQVIKISWSSDTKADSYKLYRTTCDDDYNFPDQESDFTEVYSGTDTSFTHDDTNDPDFMLGRFYYYKLAIVKNNIESKKSDYEYGIASSSTIDNFEENNISDNAQILPDNLNSANIFYFKDSEDNILSDIEDWYYVNVPASGVIQITFDNFVDIEINGLLFNKEGEIPSPLSNGDSYNLINTGTTNIEVKFRISIDMAKMLNKFGNYRIGVE